MYVNIIGKPVNVGQDIASASPDPPAGDLDRGVVIAIGISCLAGLCVIGLVIVQVVSHWFSHSVSGKSLIWS